MGFCFRKDYGLRLDYYHGVAQTTIHAKRLVHAGDRGTAGYRREGQELLRPRSMDMGGFWPSDNNRIIAVLEHDSLLRVNRSLSLLLDLRFVVRNF